MKLKPTEMQWNLKFTFSLAYNFSQPKIKTPVFGLSNLQKFVVLTLLQWLPIHLIHLSFLSSFIYLFTGQWLGKMKFWFKKILNTC